VSIDIPPRLQHAVREDRDPVRDAWLRELPAAVREVASRWRLDLGAPFRPGGQCAWVAPARTEAGEELAVKVAWRHFEAEHEAHGLRLWDGDGAVRCLAWQGHGDHTIALLLERCRPGTGLCRLSEPDQDVVIAGLLRRLWAHAPASSDLFRSLSEMCEAWAAETEERLEHAGAEVDAGLVAAGIALLRELPGSSDETVVLCTDLHAENVLAAEREPWLVIDPKPYLGDPAYDAVQHMLNCDDRLAADPAALARRMAGLLDLDPDRVLAWLFARCAQESIEDASMRAPARRLAP
jgi:streptomycin 6-kinase